MAHRLSPSEELLLARFRERLFAAVPPGSVCSLVVFGSRARGDSTEHSDLDLAVMLAPGMDRAAMQRLAHDAAWDAMEELDLQPIGLAPVALPPEPRLALHENIAREGIEIWRP